MFDVVSLCREDDPPALSTHALSPPPSHTEAEPMENGAGRDSPRNTGEPARESSECETKAPEREEDEPVENGGTSSNQEREGNGEGEGIVTETGPTTVEEHQTRKKTDSHILSKRPKQMSLKSLFARTTTSSSQTPTTATDPAEPPSRPRTRPSLAPSSLPPAPKLSSVEEFVSMEREREERVLTPLEMFQQKLVLQVSGRGRMVKGEGVESGRTVESVEEKGDSVPKPLISDDVISKLKDRPGGYYNITVGYVYIISVIVIVTVCVCVCVLCVLCVQGPFVRCGGVN